MQTNNLDCYQLLQSAKLKKKTNTEKALQHFDDFYGSVYGKRWGGIRAALLSERKYMALVNQFGDAEKTKEMLENGGAINVRRIYEAMQNEDLNPSYCATPSSETTGHGAKETKTELEKSLFEFVQKQKSTEIETLYEKDIEEGLNKLKDDVEVDEKRVLPPLDMSNFNRSLEATLTDASDLDLSRMISSEIGFAGLQEFIPATKLKGMEDFVPESQHYKYYSTTVDFPIETELETKFPFPSNVEVYTYERGNVSRFRRPIKSETGVLTHFLMDGASILPPLFLDVQPGEKVYDACSAPGGKSLFLIQTLRPDVIVCNELQESRTKRIRNLMNQYVPAFDREWASSRCVIRRGDATRCDEYGLYDRVRQLMLRPVQLLYIYFYKHLFTCILLAGFGGCSLYHRQTFAGRR